MVQMGRAGGSSPPQQLGEKATFSCVEKQVGGYLVHQEPLGAAFLLSQGLQEGPSQAPGELQGLSHEPAASSGHRSSWEVGRPRKGLGLIYHPQSPWCPRHPGHADIWCDAGWENLLPNFKLQWCESPAVHPPSLSIALQSEVTGPKGWPKHAAVPPELLVLEVDTELGTSSPH